MNEMIALFILPLLAAPLVLVPKNGKAMALVLSLLPLGILLSYREFSEVNSDWFSPLAIRFHLQVDALSRIFLYLTAIIIPFCIAIAKNLPNSFFSLTLLLQGLLIGFFTAKDLALFTIFWEAMLLPLYFMIQRWERAQANAYQFLLYMVAGSCLAILALLSLYFTLHSFELSSLKDTAESCSCAKWVFLAFLLAFLVKTPLFPFHSWLLGVYYYTPTPITILLSALLSKVGIYGILRISIDLFPHLMQQFSSVLTLLALVGVFYGALAAWRESDYKRMLAYSSFSHINFILLALFSSSSLAYTGAIVQTVNHSITATALFLVASWLESRVGSTSMNSAGGAAQSMPYLCWLTLFFVLSSIALPGTGSFVGEFITLLGLFSKTPWVAAIVSITIVFSANYMLRWMQKVYFQEATLHSKDLTTVELAIATPLIVLIVWMGVYPTELLDTIQRIFS